ncbi:hypothetical protein [Aeromicrobium sp. Leaf350]|uniref:hypothetical protein n=1 Tax=Aeromicrobium sp. Leaf350 TaxID=2876565 RepID=UPI001E62EB52|nr:hypothetical protein [Aeromicrobium sp. Leaf350]
MSYDPNTPPPSGNYPPGQASPPPGGGFPPPGGGFPPPGGGGFPPPGGPTPPNGGGGGSKTGLIIGIVVLAVLLLGGGATAAVLLLSGGDDDKDTDTRSSTEPTDDPTDEPTDDDEDEEVDLDDGPWVDTVEDFTVAYYDGDCAALLEIAPGNWPDEATCLGDLNSENFSLDDYDITTTSLDDEQDPTEATVEIEYSISDDTSGAEENYVTTFTITDDGSNWVVTDFRTA